MSTTGIASGAGGTGGDDSAPYEIDTATTPALNRRTGPAVGSGTGRGPLLGSTLLGHLVLALIGAAVLYVVTDQVDDNALSHLATFGLFVVVVAGLTLLTGLNGQVSLGHAGLMGIGGYTVALLQGHWSDQGTEGLWVLPLSLVAAVLVTAAVGVVVGAAAARLRGPYLAGATLTLGIALPNITLHFSDTFKGDQGLQAPRDSVPASLGADFTDSHWQAWITLAAALVTLVLLANLKRSKTGRDFRAVRDDEVAAQLSGLNVARVQVLAFVVSSAAAGLAGGLYAVVNLGVSPGAFGLFLSLTLLAAIVIGGLGSLPGAVIGAVVITYLGLKVTDLVNGLDLSGNNAKNLTDNLPNGLYGLLLIAVIILAPGGVAGLLRLLRGRLPGRAGGH